MKFFKNTELASLYKVSEKSVRNWIDAAEQNKLDLQLYTQNGKQYIAHTAKNVAMVEALVEKGRKYKNSRGFKEIAPTPHFYELFSTKQIFDIIANLDIHHEIPRQYNYFDGGADFWDNFANRLAEEETPNILNGTLELLEMNYSYLDKILEPYQSINIIDIGAGNALPVKPILERLIQQNKLGRYIAADISPSMLKIAEKNIKHWFGNDFPFESYELDINYDRFTEVIAEECLQKDAEDSINLVLALGGTLGNLRSPDNAYRVIRDSMGRDDLFMHSQKLDTEATRRYFDFNTSTPLAPQHKFIVDLLNIDPSYYTVEMGYDETMRSRYLNLCLNVALSIKFTFADGTRVLDCNKGDKILMWRFWHQEAMDVMKQLEQDGFTPLQFSQTNSKEYLLTISKIKSE